MLLLFLFAALAQGTLTFTSGSGSTATQFYAGFYTNVSFTGSPSTYADDNTRHFSPMRIPSDPTVGFQMTPTQTNGGVGVEITKSLNQDQLDEPYFYNFPEATGPTCQLETTSVPCPGTAPGAIVAAIGEAQGGRAGYFREGDVLTFDFNENIGAFGLQIAVRSSAGSNAGVALTVDFGGIATATYTNIPFGGELQTIWFEPEVVPKHSVSFNQVNITITGLPAAGPGTEQNGGWIVFNQVLFGQGGYNCEDAANTAALGVDLNGLPQATTDIQYLGNIVPGSKKRSLVQLGTWISGVGDQTVIICVPPGNPIITVRENTFVYQSNVDGTGLIQCGTPHVNLANARCHLDPRSTLTVSLPCVPDLGENQDDLTLSLNSPNGAFRTGLNISGDLEFLVLASGPVDARLNFGAVSTGAGTSYSCHKSNTLKAPGTCVRNGTTRGPLAKLMQFRARCTTSAGPTIPNAIELTVNYPSVAALEWVLSDIENTDVELCVPSFGTYNYQAQEAGINNVTMDVAQAFCSTQDRGTTCNNGPLNLVSILEGPGVCSRVRQCDGTFETEAWAGANATGFTMSISVNDVLLREFEQNPFNQIRECVLNTNVVGLSTVVSTSNTALSPSLDATYDCTNTNGETSGVCTPYPGNPADFFQLLNVDSRNLKDLDYRIDYTEVSVEGGENVCSTGTLEDGQYCDEASIKNICVPAVGSDEIVPEGCATKAYRPQRLDLVAQQCPTGAQCFAQDPAACRPESESCITLTQQLDCRTETECKATLAQELCLWDLLALPEGEITVNMLPANTAAVQPVCTTSGLGMAPATFHVLATEQRIQISEGGFSVTGLVDCSTAQGCSYNDYLAYVDIQKPLEYEGQQVLRNVDVTVTGTSRSYNAGKNAVNCKPVALLADPNNSYDFVYSWGGKTRTINSVCTGCPDNSCTGFEDCIVRWFAIDFTIPSQTAQGIVLDGIGQVVQQDQNGRYKSYGNVWSSLPFEVSIDSNDISDCSTVYGGTVCQPATNQGEIRRYYALAPNDGDETYSVTVKQGCDAETYSLVCPTRVDETGITQCSDTCPIPLDAEYNKACKWQADCLGPTQGPTCSFDGCNEGWKALMPYTNIIIDLTCLPNGESTIPDTPPAAGQLNQNNYRGAPYTDFFGQQDPIRYNPIDVTICCGSCGGNTPAKKTTKENKNMSPKSPPHRPTERRWDVVQYYDTTCQAPPPLSDCANPILLSEAGGYLAIFTGLAHSGYASPYSITVKELFRNEHSANWEEARPSEYPEECRSDEHVNAEWQYRIASVRPSTCSDASPTPNACGPSKPGKTCSYTYGANLFTKPYTKGGARNEQGLGQRKFTYSVGFQDWRYASPQPLVNWQVLRAHTLLRPNGYAAPEESFCLLQDRFYQTQLNDATTVVSSPVTRCDSNRPFCHQIQENQNQQIIPFQGELFKKKSEESSN